MGNKGSAAAFPTEAVTAQVVRTVNTFGPLFTKALAVAEVRAHATAHEEEVDGLEKARNKEGYRLERPPVAVEPMERGWATKLGEIKKTWKRRYFVATEEADNFVVYYFEKERDAATPAKAKGCIQPCGYIVSSMTPEEEAKDKEGEAAGAYGLRLEPLDRKRTWYLRFDSAEGRTAWKQVLQYASLKCEPRLCDDAVQAAAFRDAYARARRALGLHGYYRLDRDAKEQLGVLATQACEANVLAALYDSIAAGSSAGAGAAGASAGAGGSGGGTGSSGGAAGDGAVGGAGAASGAGGVASATGGKLTPEAERLKVAVDKELDRIVAAVVESAWPAIQARIDNRAAALSSLAGSALGSILRESETRKSDVRERTAKFIRPVARDVAAPVVPVVLGALLKPLYKAHKEAIKIFWSRVHEIIERGLKENDLRMFYRDARWQHAALLPAFRKIRALTRGEVEEEAGDAALKLLSDMTVNMPQLVELMGGVSLYEVEVLMEDHLRALVGWAIYSFVAAVERSRGGVTPMECLHSVMRAMIHDSKLRQRANLMSIFKSMLGPSVRARSIVNPAVKTILDGSVVVAPPYVVVPYAPAAGAAAAAAAAAASSGSPAGASSPTTSSAGAAAAGTGGGSTAIPTAAPVAKSKKAAAAAEVEIRAAPLAEVFTDTDWELDDVINDIMDATVSSIIEPRVAPMLARLDKLPGKLGFSAS